jgi:hypothetical protein
MDSGTIAHGSGRPGTGDGCNRVRTYCYNGGGGAIERRARLISYEDGRGELPKDG